METPKQVVLKQEVPNISQRNEKERLELVEEVLIKNIKASLLEKVKP